MFLSREQREVRKGPEIRKVALKDRESAYLRRLTSKGKDWFKVVGFTALSTVLVEGAFSREARADDLSIQKTMNTLAVESGQPSPFEFVASQLNGLDKIPSNTPEDKVAALTPKTKKLSTPGLALEHSLSDDVNLRTSVDAATTGAYALVTIKADFL
jgi:hypothetical protein